MSNEDGDVFLPLAPGTTRAAALAALRRAFAEAGLETVALDARLLAAAALGVTPTGLLTDPHAPLGVEGATRLASHARRRLAREPVARIVGEAEFWGLPFRLTQETLAPRPDTETVVEAALDVLRPMHGPTLLLDLGTGSGCILVALLFELDRACGVGIDRAPRALATARANAATNGVGGRAAFAASDWTAAVQGRFDLVVSNPPYIRAADILRLDPEVVRHDPMVALDGGADGLDAYRAILTEAGRLLAPGGHVVLELGHDQADAVAAIAAENGMDVAAVRHDLGGHRRAMTLTARRNLVSGG